MTFSWSLYFGLVGLVTLLIYGLWRRRRVDLFRLDVLAMRRRASNWADQHNSRSEKAFVALDRVLAYASNHPDRLVLFDILVIAMSGWIYKNLTLPEVDQSLLDCVQPEAPHEIKVIAVAFAFRTVLYMFGESVSGFLMLGLFLILGRLVDFPKLIPSAREVMGALPMIGTTFNGGEQVGQGIAVR